MWTKLRNLDIERLHRERDALLKIKDNAIKTPMVNPSSRIAQLEKALRELADEANALLDKRRGAAQRLANKILAARLLLEKKKAA